MASFGPDTPILLPDHIGRSKDKRIWLLWPALQLRVVAPLVENEHLNVFQKAVLGLIRAGFTNRSDIGERLSLDEELVKLVVDDLRQQHYVGAGDLITERGRAATKDSFLDPQRDIVTHVYQDPTTGSLWPASNVRPMFAKADWHGVRTAAVQFQSAGAPFEVKALAVAIDRKTPTDEPTREQVVEAVSRGEKAKQRGARARRLTSTPPERVTTRVAMISAGQPVYLPVALTLEQGEEGGNTSWSAWSPFTGKPSTFLRKLIAVRAHQWPPLMDRIEKFIGHRSEALLATYDQMDVAVRRQISEELSLRFDQRLAEHPQLLELLIVLERDVRKMRQDGDRAFELGDVVRNAWRIHELILLDVVAKYRAQLPAEVSKDGVVAYLRQCCQVVRLPVAQAERLRFVDKDDLKDALRSKGHASTPSLLAAALVSAAAGDQRHPVRVLAANRTQLLTELTHLSKDRNDGSHAGQATLNKEHGEAAWHLAQEVTAVYLGLPLPALSGKELRLDEQGR